jgi:proteic killer suppression protein
MIRTFKDSDLEEFYYEGPGRRTRRIPVDLHKVIRRKLDQLFNAADLSDLRVPPSNRLKALKAERKGYHSIRVNDQWRIVFEWERDAASEVELTNYH